MPEEIAGTGEIMRFLAHEVSGDTYVNIMQQYYPAGRVNSEKFAQINRGVDGREFQTAMDQAQEAGLRRFDERSSPASLLVRNLAQDS